MEIIGFLLVLLIVTRLFGEMAVRLGQPAMVGELMSGIFLGFLVAQLVGDGSKIQAMAGSDAFLAVTSLGAFFLMLQAGLEMRPSQIARASKVAAIVAVGGFLLPLAFGFALGWVFLPDSSFKIAQCLFLGTALAITAVAVSVKMLMDLGRLKSRFGEIIVSAAIFDDVLGLILLAVLTALIGTGNLPSPAGLALLVGKVALFFAISTVIGVYVYPIAGKLMRWMREPEAELGALLIAALGFSLLAEALGMHFIIGAFLAGLFFGRRTIDPKTYEDVKSKISGITSGFLAPIFFAAIGFQADLQAFSVAPLFVLVLVALAFVGKLAGAGLAARTAGLSSRESACVGIGMSSRGAVELVIADLALKAGLFAVPDPPPPIIAHLFSAVVFMAVVTTLVSPIMLKWLIRTKAEPD